MVAADTPAAGEARVLAEVLRASAEVPRAAAFEVQPLFVEPQRFVAEQFVAADSA